MLNKKKALTRRCCWNCSYLGKPAETDRRCQMEATEEEVCESRVHLVKDQRFNHDSPSPSPRGVRRARHGHRGANAALPTVQHVWKPSTQSGIKLTIIKSVQVVGSTHEPAEKPNSSLFQSAITYKLDLLPQLQRKFKWFLQPGTSIDWGKMC